MENRAEEIPIIQGRSATPAGIHRRKLNAHDEQSGHQLDPAHKKLVNSIPEEASLSLPIPWRPDPHAPKGANH